MLIEEIILENHKEKRGEFIKDKMGSALSSVQGIEDIDEFVENLKDIDPTPKGIYMQWIAKLIAKDSSINRIEDLPRLKDDLVNFEKVKGKLENKDINTYKTFSELFKAIEPHVNKPKSKDDKAKDRNQKRLEKLKGQIETVYVGPDGWVRIPQTKAASQFLGQGTRWCTSATNGNMHEHYATEDSLFVIYDKQNKKRSQLHISSGQYMDEADSPIPLDTIPDWAKKAIVGWYETNKAELSFKQIMTLFSKLGADVDQLPVDDDQSDLLKLMQQYGV